MRNSGILIGVHELIDQQFDVEDVGKFPHYRHLKSCRRLSDRELEHFDGVAFVESIYRKLEKNWNGGVGSDQNWRWEPRPTLMNGKDGKFHKGAEVPFERTIAILSEMRHFGLKGAWTNQMPVASKLTDEPEGRRAIDLVHQCREGVYDFIRLNLPGDKNHETPLAAAIEVLIYGLLYVFSRAHIKKLGYDPVKMKVLSEGTKQINLNVIAPLKFYLDARKPEEQKYALAWFQQGINKGLAVLLKDFYPELQLSMCFQFEAIDHEFLKPDPSLDHGFTLNFQPVLVYPQ